MTPAGISPLREDPGSRDRAVLVRGDLVMDLVRLEVNVRGQAVRLTPMEFRLLHVLAQAPGRVFSRDELLARLHAFDGKTPVDRTLDNLVARLRRKLGDHARRPAFIEAVWGIGYRFIDRSPPAAVTKERAAAAAFDSLPEPALVLDPNQRIVLVNAAGRRLWGVDAGDPVGRYCFDVVGCHTHGGASLRTSCPALEALRQGAPVEARYLASGPQAPHLRLAATYTPLAGEGEPAACLLLVRPAGSKPRRNQRKSRER